MFEFDFFKLIIIAMIALLVLGPEKLPGLAAKLGQWAGRARSVARQLRTQLEHEVMLEEAKQAQRKQAANSPPPASEPQSYHPPAQPEHTPENAASTSPEPKPAPAHPQFNLDEYARDDFPGHTHTGSEPEVARNHPPHSTVRTEP